MSDLSGIEQMIADFQKLENDMDSFIEGFLLDMALRVLAKTKKRTPVGIYDKPVSFVTKDGKEVNFTPHTGKKGGRLRDNWRISEVTKTDEGLCVEIYNPLFYAEYVEVGHIYPSHENLKGWWEGYHMCELSITEIQDQIPARYEQAWRQFCRDHLLE